MNSTNHQQENLPDYHLNQLPNLKGGRSRNGGIGTYQTTSNANKLLIESQMMMQARSKGTDNTKDGRIFSTN
jgi:hypothetical protein